MCYLSVTCDTELSNSLSPSIFFWGSFPSNDSSLILCLAWSKLNGYPFPRCTASLAPSLLYERDDDLSDYLYCSPEPVNSLLILLLASICLFCDTYLLKLIGYLPIVFGMSITLKLILLNPCKWVISAFSIVNFLYFNVTFALGFL